MSERKLITCSNDISLENLPTYVKCGKLPFGIYCHRNIYKLDMSEATSKLVFCVWFETSKSN